MKGPESFQGDQFKKRERERIEGKESLLKTKQTKCHRLSVKGRKKGKELNHMEITHASVSCHGCRMQKVSHSWTFRSPIAESVPVKGVAESRCQVFQHSPQEVWVL